MGGTRELTGREVEGLDQLELRLKVKGIYNKWEIFEDP